MFTGIIQDMGTFRHLSNRGNEILVEIETDLDLNDMSVGDSIAVNGACLTVTGKDGRVFTADISPETLSRTNLGRLRPGDDVNLEKSVRLNDFLGGHLVLGHVDGLGEIRERSAQRNAITFGIDVDESLARYVVEKGSIAVDGISLTVNRCKKRRFYVSIIPLTARQTTLSKRKAGEVVNIETDILGKYVEKLLKQGGPDKDSGKDRIDMDFLFRHGFIK
jgi:riboflavin synthase